MVRFFHEGGCPYLKGEKPLTPSSISNTGLIDGVPPLSANGPLRFIKIIYMGQAHKSNTSSSSTCAVLLPGFATCCKPMFDVSKKCCKCFIQMLESKIWMLHCCIYFTCMLQVFYPNVAFYRKILNVSCNMKQMLQRVFFPSLIDG